MLHRVKRMRDLFIPCVFGLLVLITLVCVLSSCGSGSATGANGTGSSTSGHTRDQTGGATVAVADLPPQARTTLDLIKQGGPFPYRQDGVVFGNRERILPAEPSGYYHEYTVRTPGSRDRGARRIIAARDGTQYYTDDHYASFRRIVQ